MFVILIVSILIVLIFSWIIELSGEIILCGVGNNVKFVLKKNYTLLENVRNLFYKYIRKCYWVTNSFI